ncbi:VWA domain-containing protein [Myceligenerans pegani]|uniref:VWA domain-containing protein n=1 Tax=Myceligenerans pegani TaxID=2776917 RepID=A0ABR9N182_9MICO|nr:VWA domain-containing protein [Myceligenerans sp. TRM 65318]MBE1877409.1 VWA domain-containing protein [Myceligenerans sp. TRM 65318]MBE3019680.1 VWA domain-containing protein [Myceligenerans sp. TRM 65318]
MTHPSRRSAPSVPMRRSRPLLTAVLVASLAACTAAPAGSADGADGADADGGPATSTPSPGVPELVPVDYDAPRDLTATERLMLYEPGPFAGDAFDEDAVVDAVLAMEPETTEEWQRAILGRIHGDYAGALAGTVEFQYAIDDPAAAGPADEPAEVTAVGTNHFALVLDASGSMAERAGDGTRMDAAKAALSRFVARLPEDATVSLRVYGHAGDASAGGKRESCASSAVVYDGEAGDARFADALDDVEPTGWTPLARAVRAASGDVPDEATDAIVYVVTDGLETCGGDPVAAARELADGGVEPIVNVIGFQVGNPDHEGLRAIADAGGGAYTDASSETDLEQYLDEEYSRMMDAWDAWKRAELERIEEAGRANMAEAEQFGRALMDAAEDEGRAGMEVARELGARGALDHATETAVWQYFYDRKNELWRYGYDTRTANYGDAYREKVHDWGAAYGTGTSRWSEYYRKRYEN